LLEGFILLIFYVTIQPEASLRPNFADVVTGIDKIIKELANIVLSVETEKPKEDSEKTSKNFIEISNSIQVLLLLQKNKNIVQHVRNLLKENT
jgi:hypothetical protein